MNIEEIKNIINELINDVDDKMYYNKANAFGVRITDEYAIYLRDELNKLEGERNGLIRAKNKIITINKNKE